MECGTSTVTVGIPVLFFFDKRLSISTTYGRGSTGYELELLQKIDIVGLNSALFVAVSCCYCGDVLLLFI